MTGTVFREMVRRHWRQTLYWGLGLFIYGILTVLLVPDLTGLQQYVTLARTLPEGLMQAFGLSDIEALGTVTGFIAFSYHIYMVLLMATYAVLSGLSVTSGEEESGILDVVLSWPLPRWRIILEKTAAYLLFTTVIVMLGHVGLVSGGFLNANARDLDQWLLLQGSINLLPSSFLVLAFTILMGVLVRRRATAAAIAATFVTGSFLLDTIGTAARTDFADSLRQLSFTTQYNALEVLQSGLVWPAFLGLTVVAAAMLVAAVIMFERREIRI